MKNGKYWMVWIAVCGMIGATLGTKNISGLFFTAMSESFGVGRGAVSLTLTISNLLLAAGDYLSPRLFRGENYRRLSRLCVACIVGATFLMGSATSIWLLYLLSAIRGFFSGMLGIVIGTVVLNNWFVRYNGLVTGVALASGGLVSAVLSPILSGVIEDFGWRMGWCAEALAVLLLYAPLTLLPIAFRPEDIGSVPLGGEERLMKKATTADSTITSRPWTIFAGMLLFNAFANAVSTFTNHLPGIADSRAFPAAIGAAMLSASMVANAGGKVLMGAASERFGVKRPAMLYAALIIGGLGLLSTGRSAVAMIAGGAALGLAFSLTTVVPSLMAKDLFGVEQYRSVFPTVTLVGTIANACAASLIGFSYDAAGSYLPAMLTLSAFLCGIVVLVLTLYRAVGKTK